MGDAQRGCLGEILDSFKSLGWRVGLRTLPPPSPPVSKPFPSSDDLVNFSIVLLQKRSCVLFTGKSKGCSVPAFTRFPFPAVVSRATRERLSSCPASRRFGTPLSGCASSTTAARLTAGATLGCFRRRARRSAERWRPREGRLSFGARAEVETRAEEELPTAGASRERGRGGGGRGRGAALCSSPPLDDISLPSPR